MKAKLTMTKRDIEFDLHLTMTEREARALLTVMRKIGGSPSGPRQVMDKIVMALYDADVTHGFSTGYGIHFPDTWTEFDTKDPSW